MLHHLGAIQTEAPCFRGFREESRVGVHAFGGYILQPLKTWKLRRLLTCDVRVTRTDPGTHVRKHHAIERGRGLELRHQSPHPARLSVCDLASGCSTFNASVSLTIKRRD